jgi:hypothetical protein
VQAGVTVIVNAASGGSGTEDVRLLVAREFGSQGIEADVFLAKGGAQLAALARRAREGSSQTVVAAGGAQGARARKRLTPSSPRRADPSHATTRENLHASRGR